ncbi:hypothetical protein BY996DRAFT_6420993 [Phakopsora pachyrhizi]|nr:hypothetical protein BY996DRAFT_6420993 [Phakopsora pachyrhizi]
MAQARMSSRRWACTRGSGSLGFGGLGRQDPWWALSDLPAALVGSSGLERPASEVRPLADEVLTPGRGERKWVVTVGDVGGWRWLVMMLVMVVTDGVGKGV